MASSFRHIKHFALIALIIGTSFLCTELLEPDFSNIDNVGVAIVLLDQSLSDPAKTSLKEGEVFTLGIKRSYPQFIDSILITFDTDTTKKYSASSDTGAYVATDTIYISHTFTKGGEKILMAKACFNDTFRFTQDTMYVKGFPVSIISHPESLVVMEWDTASFAVSAQGSDTITYQWYRDTTALPQFTDSVLCIPCCSISDTGLYTCIVNNGWGMPDTSAPALLTIIPVNRKPVFYDTLPDSLYAIEEGALLTIPIKAVDPEGDSVLYFIDSTTLPRPDSIHLVKDTLGETTLLWQSLAGDNEGVYTLSIAATDTIDTVYASVVVTVSNLNFAPVFDSLVDTTIAEAQLLTMTIQANDADGDSLVLQALSIPTATTFTDNGDNTGTFSWQTGYSDSGSYPISFIVMDDSLSDTCSAMVVVNDVKLIISATTTVGGTITPAGDIAVEYKASQKFDIAPSFGYHLIDVLVDSVSIGIKPTYTFTNVTENHRIHAVFAINKYLLSVTAGPNGNTLPVGDTTVNHGQATPIIALPDTGYHFTKWVSKDTNTILGDTLNDTTTVTLNYGNDTIQALFTINTYTLSIETQGNGTVTKTPDKPRYDYGDTVVLRANPGIGSDFTSWSGSLNSTANPLTLIIKEDIALVGSFAINEYSVSVATPVNGTLAPVGPQTILHGDTLTVTATPNALYAFKEWTVTGGVTPIATGTTGKFIITGDGSVAASFVIKTYAVTVGTIGNGTVTPSGVVAVPHGGDTFTVAATPSTGHHFIGWDTTGIVTIIDSSSQGKFIIASDGSITAKFAVNMYPVTVASSGNGTVTPAGALSLSHDSLLAVAATPAAGYHFVNWTTTGGITVESNTAQGSFTITGTGSITANFAINTYTVTFKAGSNGSIDNVPEVVQTVNHGDTTSPVTAIGSIGYHFTDWRGDLPSTENPLSIKGVTSNLTLTAYFSIDSLTVTFRTDGNGSLQGDTVQRVAYNGSTNEVIAFANAGYHFKDWTGHTDTDSAITVNGVTSNMLITANFELNTYTVTFKAEVNGSVNNLPEVAQTIQHGGDCAAVDPKASIGYHFKGWSGDHTGSEDPLKITNVTSDLTIYANFAIDTFTVTFIAGPYGSIIGNKTQRITYGGNCTQVTAKGNTGYHFSSWTGHASTDDELTVTNVTSDMTITANFAINRYTITIIIDPDCSTPPNNFYVTPVGTIELAHGQKRIIEAKNENMGCFLKKWQVNGDDWGNNSKIEITANQDYLIIAKTGHAK